MNHTGKFSNYLRKSFIRYASVLMLILFIVFFVFTYFNLRLTAINTNKTCNTSLSRLLGGQYENYVKNTSKISESPNIGKALNHGDATDAYRELYSFASSQQIKSIFYVFDSNRKLVLSNLYSPNQIILQQNSKMKEAIGFAENSPSHVYSGISCIPYDNGQQTAYLFCKAVTSSQKIIGYLCFDLVADSLDSAMRKNEVEMVTLTDRFDNAFYYTNKSVINSMGKCQMDWGGQNAANVTVDEKPYYAFKTVLPESNIQIITLTSTRAQKQVVSMGIVFLVSLMVLMGLLIAVFARKVAQNNSKSIDALLYAVQQCSEGNINYRIDSVTFDEFQIVYDKFNAMMVQLQILIKNNSELLERKRMMEVSQLEKQFNPHFVFNVMETLKYEILIDPKQASRMVVAFANLMRYSINNGNAKVRMQIDISYVKDYLMLQKMRFNQRLTYHIDIPDDVLNCLIPKLLIQPVVENCLSHGIENVERIEIRILGRHVDNTIELTISDNGCGIRGEQLAEIRNLLAHEDRMPSHIGLYNIQREIRLLYGEEYDLEIDSRFGHGTVVHIRIPFERNENNCTGS